MILKPPYRYEKEADAVPHRDLYRVYDAEGTNILACWSEANAQGIVAALDTIDKATRLAIENEELKRQLEAIMLSS